MKSTFHYAGPNQIRVVFPGKEWGPTPAVSVWGQRRCKKTERRWWRCSLIYVKTHKRRETHTRRVMLHSKFRSYLQQCPVCTASSLSSYSCLEAALQHHFHLQYTITRLLRLRSVTPATAAFFFFLPLPLLKTRTQAPECRALRKTKSCTVRRCQRRAPTHAAPSENPANAAAANCAAVKGTALQ